MTDLRDLEAVVRLIRVETRAQRLSFKELHERASQHGPICLATVSKLASGETRYPRFDSVRYVLAGLGYRLLASPAVAQQRPAAAPAATARAVAVMPALSAARPRHAARSARA